MERMSFTNLAQQGILGILAIVLSSNVAFGATYYVRTNGNDSNSGSTNDASGAWRSIGRCAGSMVPGDVCRVQAGTYAEVVTESTSGSAGNYITYVADGAVTNNGWVITGDYVRIIGFIVEGGHTRDNGIYLQNADYVEVWNNTVQNFEGDAIRTDSGGRAFQSNNCLFIGNVTKRARYKDYQVRGSHNVVAYNEADTPEEDFIYLFGQYNRLFNNYSHGITASAAAHTDFIQSGGDSALGLGHSLFEANFYADASGGDHHCTNNQTNSASLDSHNIFRRNVWSSGGNAGGQCHGLSSSQHYVKMYHETIAYAAQYTSVYFQGGAPSGTGSHNNIWYDAWWTGKSNPSIYSHTPASHDYNLLYSSTGSVAFPSEVNAESHSLRNVDPLFVNAGSRDYRLQSTSPAVNAGGPLTTVTSANGTGTTFSVADAAYFLGDDPSISQYGGNLVVGDTITVGTDVVTIASISGNAITVTAPFSWASGEPVYFGSDTRPDLGALPYKAGGYDLTAGYSVSNGTVTVTPSDATLVRFVVCYEDGVPTTVASSSPYTCSVGSGSLEVRLYPRFASRTLWVRAPLGPAAARNVVIK